MTLRDVASKFKRDLSSIYGDEESFSLFLIAVEYHLNLNRNAYQLKKEDKVSEDGVIKLEHLLNRLLTGEPIQYILGETQFYGLNLKVNPSVLIPRPETEELVDWVLEKVKRWVPIAIGMGIHERLSLSAQRSTILDIGTGSGCIAISLKKNLPQASVSALDISSASIATAKENAILNDVEVEFIEQDIFDIQIANRYAPYTVIVSNPPYIKEEEKAQIHQNVLANEPHHALFVSDDNPLLFYKAIADFALKNLEPNGLLFFEINEYLGKETVDMLKDKQFRNIELRKDMQEKDRMICCKK